MELVEQLITDYRVAPLALRERAVLDYAVKLTRTPGQMEESDVQLLKQHGWTDSEILQVAAVTAYFNFINRLADGLGVDLERDMLDRDALGPVSW